MMQGVLDLFGSMLPKPEIKTGAAPKAAGKRHIRLVDQIVPYMLTRVRRRTIGMVVGTQGLEVRAPRWVSLSEIEAALQERAVWIVRKLDEMQRVQDQLHQSRIDWRDGCEVPYLGQPMRVNLAYDTTRKRVSAQWQDGALCLTFPAPATSQLSPTPPTAAEMCEAVQAWMMKQARPHFEARLNHFAPMLGVQWHKLSLSSAATRWGSAGRSRDGTAAIRLNWRLMHHRPEVIDYVVVHELSHLRVMDHSPRFWATVGSVLPDYEQRRRVLRDEPLPPWV
jgi:predicted metal-dependent hydrolase